MSFEPLLLCAAVALITGMTLGRRYPRLWLGATLVATAAMFATAVGVLGGAGNWEWRSALTTGGEILHLRIDGISDVFLALLSVVGGAGAVYAREYWPDERHPGSAPRGRMWWNAMLLSMAFILMSVNGLHFLIGWELFTLCSYFLVTLDRQRGDSRAAGWLYLAASHAGTLFLFAFFGSLAARTGTWALGNVRDHADLAPLFWLALCGFGVKTGLFPVHVWLPSAHANAPSHVSALMSGVAIKMGVYGLVRFSGWLPIPPAAGWVVLGIGGVTAVLGIAFALAQDDLKRLLAYCSVENVGIIAIGIGAALLGLTHGNPPWVPLVLAGALFHVWNHGLFKSLLFLSAGAVLHTAGTREMSRLGGLWRTMPWTASAFAVGAVAISALPPLNGFVSEWLLYLGLFDAAISHGPGAWMVLPAVIMLTVSGALSLATFIKAGSVVFLGVPRSRAAAHAHECGRSMRGPMIVLAAACVAGGVAPMLLWPALARAVQEWNPAFALADPPAPLFTLGGVSLAFAVLLSVAGGWLTWRAGETGVRRALTWDCGYATPTARMQYTAGSFAGIAAGWFAWLLQPARDVRRPRGPFPDRASRLERVPETVLEHVIAPLGRGILWLARQTRRLQHGRVQFYLVYLAGGVAALAVLVWLDARS